MRNDEQIIRALAKSAGMQDIYNTKYGASRYDAATGTLYCEGLTIPKSMVAKALEYYERQKNYNKVSAEHDNTSMEQYLVSVVACNAIQMLIDNISEKTA